MKDFLRKLKMLFSLMFLSAIYGGTISAVLDFLIGKSSLFVYFAMAFSLSLVGAWLNDLDFDENYWGSAKSLFWNLAKCLAFVLVLAFCLSILPSHIISMAFIAFMRSIDGDLEPLGDYLSEHFSHTDEYSAAIGIGRNLLSNEYLSNIVAKYLLNGDSFIEEYSGYSKYFAAVGIGDNLYEYLSNTLARYFFLGEHSLALEYSATVGIGNGGSIDLIDALIKVIENVSVSIPKYASASFFGILYAGLAAFVGLAVCVALIFALNDLAARKKTVPVSLVEEHIAWIFSFPVSIFRFLTSTRSSVIKDRKLETKQRAWDTRLIIAFSEELKVVFPEEWDEWQHWISDMLESRTRMQSKGMNHRLISLITFYRLTRFAFHIGIGKVFILATRRATR